MTNDGKLVDEQRQLGLDLISWLDCVYTLARLSRLAFAPIWLWSGAKSGARAKRSGCE